MKKTRMLKKNYEFSIVFSKGTYYSGKAIEAFILNNRQKSNYLGLAISSKAGHAYQRNRIKRLLRENYKNMEVHIIPGVSIVFLLKKKINIDEVDFYQVKDDMQEILEKAKVIDKSDLNEKNIIKNN